MDPGVDMAAFFREFYAQFDIVVMGRRAGVLSLKYGVQSP
jgi:hypothetical protein